MYAVHGTGGLTMANYIGKYGYIDAEYAIDYANNSILKSIDANDIARMPRADVRQNVHG